MPALPTFWSSLLAFDFRNVFEALLWKLNLSTFLLRLAGVQAFFNKLTSITQWFWNSSTVRFLLQWLIMILHRAKYSVTLRISKLTRSKMDPKCLQANIVVISYRYVPFHLNFWQNHQILVRRFHVSNFYFHIPLFISGLSEQNCTSESSNFEFSKISQYIHPEFSDWTHSCVQIRCCAQTWL